MAPVGPAQTAYGGPASHVRHRERVMGSAYGMGLPASGPRKRRGTGHSATKGVTGSTELALGSSTGRFGGLHPTDYHGRGDGGFAGRYHALLGLGPGSGTTHESERRAPPLGGVVDTRLLPGRRKRNQGRQRHPCRGGHPLAVDADAKGDEEPTQTFMNVDGVVPALTNPWRALDAPTGPPATLAVTFPQEGSLSPREEKTPLGDSPSKPLGVKRTIQIGASSIYEYDADSPIGGPLEDSPVPVAIPSPGGPEQGSVCMSATLQTPSTAGSQQARADMGATPRLSATPDQAGAPLAQAPQGLPTLPLWGSTRALPRARREGPRTWDSAVTPFRPAALAWGWHGSTGVGGPSSPTLRHGDHPGAAPSLEPRGSITARGARILGITSR